MPCDVHSCCGRRHGTTGSHVQVLACAEGAGGPAAVGCAAARAQRGCRRPGASDGIRRDGVPHVLVVAVVFWPC